MVDMADPSEGVAPLATHAERLRVVRSARTAVRARIFIGDPIFGCLANAPGRPVVRRGSVVVCTIM